VLCLVRVVYGGSGGSVAMWWLSQWWCLYRPCARRGWPLQTRRQAGWLQRASLPNTSTQAPGQPPNPLSLPSSPPPRTKNFFLLPFNNVKLSLQALSGLCMWSTQLSQNLYGRSVSAVSLLKYVMAAAHATYCCGCCYLNTHALHYDPTPA